MKLSYSSRQIHGIITPSKLQNYIMYDLLRCQCHWIAIDFTRLRVRHVSLFCRMYLTTQINRGIQFTSAAYTKGHVWRAALQRKQDCAANKLHCELEYLYFGSLLPFTVSTCCNVCVLLQLHVCWRGRMSGILNKTSLNAHGVNVTIVCRYLQTVDMIIFYWLQITCQNSSAAIDKL